MPTPMTLAELQQALRAVEPAAVLVAPRVLENIVRQRGDFSEWVWQVPHRKSTIVDRQTLFRHVEQEELPLGPDQLLPPTVILLARPEAEELEAGNRVAVLLEYWQRLFHAAVHLALENLWAEGKLTEADIADRLKQLGPASVAEIRTVLVQDHYLPANPDDRSLYMEFAAVFLELSFFGAHLLPVYFPILRDLSAVKKLLAQDVHAEELYERMRLACTPDPVPRTASNSQEAHEYYWKLVHSSEHAAQQGNVVLAAIQRSRAARVAPAALGYTTRQDAVNELLSLVDRLQKALELTTAEADEWRKHLPSLLDKADQGTWPVEAALLYDLQKVCLDHEHEVYALDLVEWVMSGGKRPIKRPLPAQRAVHVARTLRGTLQRLSMARLSDEHRHQFAALLQQAVSRSEEHLRQNFRPRLTAVLYDVGLKPTDALEATALRKVVEELLDRILASGFITFSELRDTLSRNQLKLPDLTDPQDFIRGDPLLRMDRRLSTALDGVYRPSELYLRWLERFTALNFGTPLGRMITLFFTVPFVGAFVLVEAIVILLHFLNEWFFHVPELPAALHYPLIVLMGFFFLGLIHSRRFRGQCAEYGGAVGRPLRSFLIDGPMWLLKHASLKSVTATWFFQLFYWYIVKPLAIGGVIAFLIVPRDGTFKEWLMPVSLVLLATMFLINSRIGQGVSEAFAEVMIRFLDLLRGGLLPGLARLVVDAFKKVLHLGEVLLFSVDEWLRFRGGDSRPTMVIRAILSLLWFPVAFLLRFNMVVLVEPAFHPFKLPIASVATKFMVPILKTLGEWLPGQLTPVFGYIIGWALSAWLIFWLPDVVAFIVWEMKENWRLYRANRKQVLQAIPIGRHGETMRGLLQPGFHTGTVPKLFTRLRKAERKARHTGNWSGVRGCQAALAEVQHAVHQFVTREFCELLDQTEGWQGLPIRVSRVSLATKQIRIELSHPRAAEQPLCLEFELQDNHLAASIAALGWLRDLPPGQRLILQNALAILYKLAGVDLIHEPMPAELGGLDGHAAFHQLPITWQQCVACWQNGTAEGNPASLLGQSVRLLPDPARNGHPDPGGPDTHFKIDPRS